NGTAQDGGAILAGNASVTLDHDVLRNNHAINGGGALSVYDQDSNVWLTNSSLRSNTSDTEGGGVDVNYGQLVISSTTIGGTKNSQGNVAPAGGGLYNNDGEVAIYSSHVDHNHATGGKGGGLYNCCYTVVMQGGTVSHNLVTNTS